jgi:hypothetical protein
MLGGLDITEVDEATARDLMSFRPSPERPLLIAPWGDAKIYKGSIISKRSPYWVDEYAATGAGPRLRQ